MSKLKKTTKTSSFNLDTLTRRQLRYWCYRIQNDLAGGASSAEAPKGLREAVEAIEAFTLFAGWNNFTIKWDWTMGEPRQIIPLQMSLAEVWEKECLENAKELPTELLAKLEAKRVAERLATRPPVKEVIIDAVLYKGEDEATVTTRDNGESSDVRPSK